MDGTLALGNGHKTGNLDTPLRSELASPAAVSAEHEKLVFRKTADLIGNVDKVCSTRPISLADIQFDVSRKTLPACQLNSQTEEGERRTLTSIPGVLAKASLPSNIPHRLSSRPQHADKPRLQRLISEDELQTPTLSPLSSVFRTFGNSSASPELSSQEQTSLDASVISTLSNNVSNSSLGLPVVSSGITVTREKRTGDTQDTVATKEIQPQSMQITQISEGIRSEASAAADTAQSVSPHILPGSPKISPRSRVKRLKIRPKPSVPLNVPAQESARQCIAAAETSRLNPHALHEEEYSMLREHISHAQVTTYLNIRNRILRLWLRKPSVMIARDEAIGCAQDGRWSQAASVCFDWLARRGYINYGCVEMKDSQRDASVQHSQDVEPMASQCLRKEKRTIAIIGAGMAGLGCARQLHNLFKQYGNLLAELGLDEPNIVVLEGRSRIGGRVYSRPLQVQPRHRHPEFRQSRCIAEMGGMIVTGFDRGNPMNVLIRGQLGLHYHSLLSATTIYDIDGKPADATRDRMVEDLFNECLDRVSKYKFKIPSQTVVEGNRDYINQGRDCHSEGHKTIARAEEGATTQARLGGVFKDTKAKGWQLPERSQSAPASTSSLQAQEATLEDCEMLGTEKHALARSLPPTTEMSATNVTNAAGLRLKRFGWKLKPGVEEKRDIDLDPAASVPGATLGSVIEDAIKQFGELVEMSAQDLRLLNWHIANLEYSNATNHSRLSLLGWDIDAGNEWEGKHSMIIGGYQSVPRGLMLCPTPLHVRKQKVVKKINYVGPDDASRPNLCESHKSPVVIELEDGATFDADYIVNTIPLGVLKHGDVQFDPPLPQWKEGPITRLGYGVLNKIVLTYRQPFWDTERDIFGVLREPSKRFSLDQRQYSKRRGRMFQWFNVTKTAGVPCLIALMAGDAAVDAEKTSNDKLIAEAAAVLRSVFGAHNVPEPIEAVLTRWSSDRFSRGSYSSAGPAMQLDDYDAMARPVGKHLHFAGEHTIGTHPATVHGAYLSGLRAASDVFEEIVGPIKFSMPLVQSKDSLMTTMKRKLTPDEDGGKASDDSSGSRNSRSGRSAEPDANSGSRRCLEVRDLRTQELISKQVGDRPSPPSRPDDDPYQLFSKANYERASNNCVQSHRPGQGHPTPDKVRALLSKMWRSAGAEERLPYAEAAAAKRREYDAALTLFNAKIAEWDRRSTEVRRNYERAHAENGSQDVETIRQTELPATSELCRPELDNIETQDESCHMP